MLRFRLLISICIVFTLIINYSKADLPEEEHTVTDNPTIAALKPVPEDEEIIKDIESLENLAKVELKSRRGIIVPIEDTEMLYEAMIQILQGLTESIKDVNKAYTFLKAKGIDRIIAYNFLIPHNNVRINLLLLTKSLFEVAPITTAKVIPDNIVDGLLDIFENEKNLAMKAHALDVLYLWLPNNPAIQARVMKMKGLEPFYNQVSKLDISVVQTLLDLFSKILKEHLSARKEKIHKTKADFDKFRLYQRIGLIERMSTSTLCSGLLNIFEVVWNFSKNDILITVFEIIENIKPFCIKMYGGNTKAIAVFKALLNYVHNKENVEYLLKHHVNVTDLELVIQEYVNRINIPARKDEL